MLAVLIQRGRADAAQFATSQLRLEQIARVHGAFRLASADDGVQFINEEDDLAVTGRDLLEEGLESLLELTAVLRAGHHAAEVHADESLVLERIGNVSGDDAARETFRDGGLAHARLTDEHRVVLRAAAEHLHDAADFFIAPDHGVDLACLRAGGEIRAVLLKGLVLALGILVSDTLRATYGA